MMVRPLLRLWRCRDVILWRLLRGFDIRTKEHILCAPLRLCVRCLFAGTARTFTDIFCFTQRRKVPQSICEIIFLFAMLWGGRRHDMTSLRVLEIPPGISSLIPISMNSENRNLIHRIFSANRWVNPRKVVTFVCY